MVTWRKKRKKRNIPELETQTCLKLFSPSATLLLLLLPLFVALSWLSLLLGAKVAVVTVHVVYFYVIISSDNKSNINKKNLPGAQDAFAS